MKLNEIYISDFHNIELTVALPIYNSKKIAWLALESLSNQIDINFDWELIVYEEEHDNSIFLKIIGEYLDRLKNVNCKRVLFITRDDKVNLISKWMTMGLESSLSSKVYMLHAADCYSPKMRLKISYEKILKENYDWYDQKKGYFYSFISNKVFLYDCEGLTNLNMSLNIDYIKTLPYSEINKGIDGYIFNHITKTKKNKVLKYSDQNLYHDSIDTHGLNNISLNRETYFSTKPNIFKSVDFGINDLNISLDIINRLKGLLIEINPIQNKNVLHKEEKNIIDQINLVNNLKPKNMIKTNSKEILKPKNTIKTNSKEILNLKANKMPHNTVKSSVAGNSVVGSISM
jgi:hypothetical protein